MQAREQQVCGLCTLDPAKYVCPRCGVPYCSLKCYKDEQKHLKCSESFYRDCVMDDLKTQQTKDPKAAKQMTEALQRFHEQYDQEGEFDDGDQDELDSDDDEPLEKRLEGINLDDADEVWKNLTDEERQQFKKFTENLNLEDIVPEWAPWWLEDPVPINLVEEIKDTSTAISDEDILLTSTRSKVHKSQPDILENISSMSSLTRVKPNEHVKRGLTNVIASYVWTARLYNGEFLSYDNPNEVAAALISLSSFLARDTVFATFENALADVSLNACRTPELFDGGPGLQSTLSKDVYKILNGPSTPTSSPSINLRGFDKNIYILSALSDCYKLLVKVTKKTPQKPKASGALNSEQIIPASSDVLPIKMSQSETVTDSSSFEKTFSSTPKNSIFVDSKLLTKAKRKVHYLLAFANEYNIL